MTSTQTEGDLIDLHVSSPELPRGTPSCSSPYEGEFHNLLDTELPILEQKLQNACNKPSVSSSRESIDVEDILITIDDDTPTSNLIHRPMQRSNSEILLEFYTPEEELTRSLSCDNLEALGVLMKLDEILNESLLESNFSKPKETVEECLEDLDNYLMEFDSGGSDQDVPDESREVTHCGNSESSIRTQPMSRNHPNRSTVAVTGHERPYLKRNVLRRSLGEVPLNRTSATGADSDEEIDWSWVNDVPNASSERELPVETPPEGAKDDRRASAWLRSSMRRLRHIRLPSDAGPADAVMDEVLEIPRNETVVIVRPVSAPSRIPSHSESAERARSRSRSREARGVNREPGGRARSSSASSRSRRPRSLSSSVSSMVSSMDSTPSCTPAPTPIHNNQEPGAGSNNARRPCERTRPSDMPEAESPLGHWPHSLNSMLACLGCTLGLFNISRFAMLTIHFGANFIFQFFFLTMVVGLPLFTLELCLGQQLGAGVIDMWRISPLFQGVGVALLASQALIGLYSIIGVSWMFVYFRDSFITKFERYRWSESFVYYRPDSKFQDNSTAKLQETVPDYFSGVVLQRHHLASGNSYSTIKFQSAFNLAVVWMIVFVSLSKGLRSYGKVIYVFTLVPILTTFVLCAKLLGMMPPEFINVIFPETSWDEFFLNTKSWVAAGQEVFLTWGLLGAAVMQIASHNKNKHLLQRDSSLIAVITITVLLLIAFLANTCVQIMRSYGYNYLPDSFEKMSTYTFMRPTRDPLPPTLAGTPVRYMVHNSFILGERITHPGADPTSESGYQVLRLATELVPTTLALLGPDQISPFWSVLFYFVLILYGIAQQLAIWHCVITGIMAIRSKILKSWETTITFFTCACGFVIGLPMATEFGIYVVYFMDFTVGGHWWLILIMLLQIIAVFMVRGRPYSGDTVVTALFRSPSRPCLLSWAPVLLSFTWNVILPVALMVLCIITFKNGYFKELFVWHRAPSASYWPLWARQIGAMLQLFPVLCVPLVAVIQSYRYLNNGPTDILDRIQLLYRPPIGEHMDELAVQEATSASLNNNNSLSPMTNITSEDPPPKYTPPPSYTTATGARLAKLLRQSIRRSMRRITSVLGESSSSRRPANTQLPPPDYNTVLVEMNQPQNNENDERQHELSTITGSSSMLTAADVASILRNSFRRSFRAAYTIRRSVVNDGNTESLSAENLVESAVPIGETSLVMENLSNLGSSDPEVKPDNLASVI